MKMDENAVRSPSRFFSLLLLLFLPVACGDSDDESTQTYSLSDGTYLFSPSTVKTNTCWDPEIFPGGPLPAYEFDIDVSRATVVISSPVHPALGDPIVGNLSGNQFNADYSREPLVFTKTLWDGSSPRVPLPGPCTLEIEGEVDATLTADNAFSANLVVTVSELDGGGCTTLEEGGYYRGFLPYPNVYPEPCSFSFSGSGVRARD